MKLAVVQFLRRVVDPIARDELDRRREAVLLAQLELDGLRGRLRAVDAAIAGLSARLDTTPLGPALTIHAAHARHPGVQALFAARGLPNCPACPVGADETLGEAAFAEGFELAGLIVELRALGL